MKGKKDLLFSQTDKRYLLKEIGSEKYISKESIIKITKPSENLS
jgi:hypothetical protein